MDDSPIQTALCVIGHPIGGNPTQFVAARALASLGLDWQFLSFDVPSSKIANAVAGIDSLGFRGAMIADPYQTQVAGLLAVARGDGASKPDPNTWHDFIFRNEQNEFVLSNLCADALRQIIDLHVNTTGRELKEALLVGEQAELKNLMAPFLPSLPANRSTVTGAQLSLWNTDGDKNLSPEEATAASGAEPHQDEEAIERLPAEEMASSAKLVIWASDQKPKKKLVSKAPPPDVDFLLETIGGLNPASLCIDLSGTAMHWFATARNADAPPIVNITKVEWDVRRLALAIRRWTTREPNLDAMREAIEEYLEV